MHIHEKELWERIRQSEATLTPVEYYPYKTGSVGSSYIAEDEPKYNESEDDASDVTRIVDLVINKAIEKLGIGPDNKTAVMCKVDIDGSELYEVYFVTFDNKRIICTEIRSEHAPITVPK